MKKVKEEHIQLIDKWKDLLTNIHFTDTYATTNHVNNIEEITNLVFNTTPKWIETLFEIRNYLVNIIGIKTTVPPNYSTHFKVGGYIKFFKIFEISNDEIILGANDSHLNFRVIVSNDHSKDVNIKLITLVAYNNNIGRIYMALIKRN